MTDGVSTEVKCGRCKQVVTGYEHRTAFVFVDGERVAQGCYAALSCGCEIQHYGLDGDIGYPNVVMVDLLLKKPVLHFQDDGPMNDLWNPEDDDNADIFDWDEE